jgi:hypothetical protein
MQRSKLTLLIEKNVEKRHLFYMLHSFIIYLQKILYINI